MKKEKTTFWEKQVAMRLKMFRLKAGLSRRHVARLTNVTAVSLDNWEKGICTCPVKYIPLFAFLYKVKPIDFIPDIPLDKATRIVNVDNELDLWEPDQEQDKEPEQSPINLEEIQKKEKPIRKKRRELRVIKRKKTKKEIE